MVQFFLPDYRAMKLVKMLPPGPVPIKVQAFVFSEDGPPFQAGCVTVTVDKPTEPKLPKMPPMDPELPTDPEDPMDPEEPPMDPELPTDPELPPPDEPQTPPPFLSLA